MSAFGFVAPILFVFCGETMEYQQVDAELESLLRPENVLDFFSEAGENIRKACGNMH